MTFFIVTAVVSSNPTDPNLPLMGILFLCLSLDKRPNPRASTPFSCHRTAGLVSIYSTNNHSEVLPLKCKAFIRNHSRRLCAVAVVNIETGNNKQYFAEYGVSAGRIKQLKSTSGCC
jgi:hypothetical protein